MAIPTERLKWAFFISLICPLGCRLSVTPPPTCLPFPAHSQLCEGGQGKKDPPPVLPHSRRLAVPQVQAPHWGDDDEGGGDVGGSAPRPSSPGDLCSGHCRVGLTVNCSVNDYKPAWTAPALNKCSDSLGLPVEEAGLGKPNPGPGSLVPPPKPQQSHPGER